MAEEQLEDSEDGSIEAASASSSGPASEDVVAPASQAPTPEQYSVFSKGKRLQILTIATMAGFLSPMTANILLPALPNLADSLSITLEQADLTITFYMVFQALSPMLFGSMTDTLGRRPLYIICITLYVAANVGLANLPNSYAGVLVLRMLQASGSASMISIGAGSVADVSHPSQRGVAMGIFTGGSTVGPSIGPIVGAILDQYFGWRSIFWFCFVAGALVLALVILFLPETMRKLVGDGSQAPPTILHFAIIDLLRGRHRKTEKAPSREKPDASHSGRSRYLPGPLQCLTRPEVILLLIVNAVPFASYYCLTATLSDLFEVKYGLSTLQVGLVFLSPGVAVAVGNYLVGRLLDRDYARLHATAGLPIERARLSRFPIYMMGYTLAMIVYGWTIEYDVYLAVPIIMLFISCLFGGFLFTSAQTLLLDWFPSQSASVSACNNLFRCLSGAVATSVINLVLTAIGAGWTFTLSAFLSSLTLIVTWVIISLAPKWIESRKADQ